jgi:hypothetical protein
MKETKARQYVGMLKLAPHPGLCKIGVPRLREKRPSQS